MQAARSNHIPCAANMLMKKRITALLIDWLKLPNRSKYSPPAHPTLLRKVFLMTFFPISSGYSFHLPDFRLDHGAGDHVSVFRLQQFDDAGVQRDLARTNGNQFGDLYWFQVPGSEVATAKIFAHLDHPALDAMPRAGSKDSHEQHQHSPKTDQAHRGSHA
jgi:hypothetical protein